MTSKEMKRICNYVDSDICYLIKDVMCAYKIYGMYKYECLYKKLHDYYKSNLKVILINMYGSVNYKCMMNEIKYNFSLWIHDYILEMEGGDGNE